LGENYDKI